MNAVQQLERLGYVFLLHQGALRFHFRGAGQPDPAIATPLLERVRAHKADALAFIRRRQSDEAARDWDGAVVDIRDLPAFRARHGLRIVRGEWRPGTPRPVLLVEQVNR